MITSSCVYASSASQEIYQLPKSLNVNSAFGSSKYQNIQNLKNGKMIDQEREQKSINKKKDVMD